MGKHSQSQVISYFDLEIPMYAMLKILKISDKCSEFFYRTKVNRQNEIMMKFNCAQI